MAERPSWDTIYEGSPPCDIGRPQPAFAALAAAGKLRGRVLDAGCGTGEHTLLAAQQGAQAMGIDIAMRAVDKARGKAAERGINAMFEVEDPLDQAALEPRPVKPRDTPRDGVKRDWALPAAVALDHDEVDAMLLEPLRAPPMELAQARVVVAEWGLLELCWRAAFDG